MAEIFRVFVSRIGPLVSACDVLYSLFTVEDTRTTISFLLVVTYALIYMETIICLLPVVPLVLTIFIFYNYFYEVRYTRAPNLFVRNMRMI